MVDWHTCCIKQKKKRACKCTGLLHVVESREGLDLQSYAYFHKEAPSTT
uniref:Membrane magnesium transporter n=1 Tax=Rhizophora mucronata TaxID=61149 RepID=A0A2P2JZL7_RHIMU